MTARVTRTVACCALSVWLTVLFVAATVAQVYGLWTWEPTPGHALAFAAFVAAAYVSVLWIPAEDTDEGWMS